MNITLDVVTNLSQNLRFLRTSRGLLQKDLALELGLSVGAISHYENGTHLPDIVVLYRLSVYYGVSLDLICSSFFV